MNATAVRQTAEERKEAVVAAAPHRIRSARLRGHFDSGHRQSSRRLSALPVSAVWDQARHLHRGDPGMLQPGDHQVRGVSPAKHVRGLRIRTMILHAMGFAYCDLLADRDMLRLQMQAYAACDDPEIRRVVREEWTVAVRLCQTCVRCGHRRHPPLVRRGHVDERLGRRRWPQSRNRSEAQARCLLTGLRPLFLPAVLSD